MVRLVAYVDIAKEAEQKFVGLYPSFKELTTSYRPFWDLCLEATQTPEALRRIIERRGPSPCKPLWKAAKPRSYSSLAART